MFSVLLIVLLIVVNPDFREFVYSSSKSKLISEQLTRNVQGPATRRATAGRSPAVNFSLGLINF